MPSPLTNLRRRRTRNRPAMPFRSDRAWTFEQPSELVWQRLTSTDEYRSWWPWLAEFRAVGGFGEGARWHCTVSPPLPYEVRFAVLVQRVEPCRLVRARVVGDIEGEARLDVTATPDGCVARLRSELAPAHPLLRGVGAAARPVVEWGHDWVLDQGRQQFVDRALQDAGPPCPPSAAATSRRSAASSSSPPDTNDR